MKNFFGYFLSFILMVFMAILLIFNIFSFSIRKTTTFYYLNHSDYYDKVKIKIENNIKDYVFEEKLRTDYINYFDNAIIKYDIYKLLNNKEINHIDNLKQITSKYTDDNQVIDNYSKNINNIYSNNLFPIKEYNFLYKFYIGIENILFINILLLTIILSTIMCLYLLKYEIFYIKSSFLSLSFLLLFLFIFMKFMLFKISLTNLYLKHILNLNINIYITISILIFLYLLLFKKKKMYS